MRLLPVLAAGCFVSSLAMRLIDPVVPGIARDLGVSTHTVAMLATAYAIPYALGQPVLGALGDALGKARIIKIALAGLAVCLAATVVAPTIEWLFVARIIGGAAGGGVIPLSFAMIGDRIPFDQRQVALSRVLSMIIAGQVTGSLGSGLIGEAFGWRAAMALGAGLTILALAATLLALKARPDAEHPASSIARMRDGYRDVFRNPLAVVCFSAVFVEGIAIFGLFPYVATLLEARGAGGLKEAGFVLAGFAAGGLIYTALVRVLLTKLGVLNVVRAGGAISGLGILLLTFNVAWPVEMAMFVIVGVGFYMIHNSLQTQATELAPLNRGSAVAAHAFFFFLGQAAGPIIFGQGFAYAGVAATIAMAGLAMAVTGWLTAAGLSSRSRFERQDA